MGNTTSKLGKLVKLSARFGIDCIGAGVAVHAVQKVGVQNQYALAGAACVGGGLTDMLIGKKITDKCESIVIGKIVDKKAETTATPIPAETTPATPPTETTSADIVRGCDASAYLSAIGITTDISFAENHLYRFYTVNAEVMFDDLGTIPDSSETAEDEE